MPESEVPHADDGGRARGAAGAAWGLLDAGGERRARPADEARGERAETAIKRSGDIPRRCDMSDTNGTAFDRYVTVRQDGGRLSVEGPAAWVARLDMRDVERRAALLMSASPHPIPPEPAAILALRLDFAAWLGLMSLRPGVGPGAPGGGGGG